MDDLRERLRATYTRWNNPPSPGLPEGAGIVLEAAAALDAMEARSEKEIGEVVDQRDAAESALHRAYQLVMGREPEWSNLYGFDDALSDMQDRLDAAEARLAEAREALRAYSEDEGGYPLRATPFRRPTPTGESDD